MNKLKTGLATLAIALMVSSVSAQDNQHRNVNVRAGEKALLNGEFKSAISHLQKALPAEAEDEDVHYLLGYALFQTGDFKKAGDSFNKVVALQPRHASGLYYKGKSNHNIALGTEAKLTDKERQVLLQSAITDYSAAIALNGKELIYFQNRGTAYRDLGILIGTAGTATYNKALAIDAYNKAVTDFEKVLSFDASRKDIQTEVKKAKIYRDNLK